MELTGIAGFGIGFTISLVAAAVIWMIVKM